MVNFINEFVQTEAFRQFIAMFDGYKNTPIVIKTFFSLFIVSFVLYIIRRIFWG